MDKYELEKLLVALPRLSRYEKIVILWVACLILSTGGMVLLPLAPSVFSWGKLTAIVLLTVPFCLSTVMMIPISLQWMRILWTRRQARSLSKEADTGCAEFILSVAEQLWIFNGGRYMFRREANASQVEKCIKVLARCPPDCLAVFLCSVIYLNEKPEPREVVLSHADAITSILRNIPTLEMFFVAPRRFMRRFLAGLEKSRHKEITVIFHDRVCDRLYEFLSKERNQKIDQQTERRELRRQKFHNRAIKAITD